MNGLSISVFVSVVLALSALAQSPAPVRASVANDRIVTTRKIQFVTGRVSVTDASAPVIARIADVMQENEASNFIIEAHADATGDEAHNLELSQARASVVVDALVLRGVDRARLRAIGRGSSEPIVASTSPEAWRNRRVEVLVIERAVPATATIAVTETPLPPAVLPSVPLVNDGIMIGLLEDEQAPLAPLLALLGGPRNDDLAPPRFTTMVAHHPLIGLIDASEGELFVPSFGAHNRAPRHIKMLED